jgi:hypothetical protein
LEDLAGQIIEGIGLGYDQTGLAFSQYQQGITRLNAEEFPGFLGNYDLAPVTDFGGAEDLLGFLFAEDVFASGHFITSFIFFILFTPKNYSENRPGCQVRGGENIGENF